MGSNGAEYIKVSGIDKAECPEATVEIKIKTLDSQTYTMRVDKCVPVPALKDQIAIVTGVLSEQQRLICRGKVLKDDQLLSAYHVEDGHTLHLVVRQHPPESNPDTQGATDASSPGNLHSTPFGPGVFVGTLNLSEQPDGMASDMSRIFSAVLGSIGIANLGSGSEGVDLNGLGNLRNSVRQQSEQGGPRDHSSSSFDANARSVNLPPLDSMHLPVVTDSLTTLSQYLTHLREEFDASVGGPSGISMSTNGSNRQGGLPTPELLSDVMRSTRQLVVDQAAECLLHLSSQLRDQANVTDATDRMRIQSLAWRSGAFFQNLGALLLELGRTTMTLRIGQTPDHAVVNAGPAVFVSATGPNPLMVQPQPFQPLGSSFVPRNIDIRIRTGSTLPGQDGTEGSSSSATRALPVRTLVAAVPASVEIGQLQSNSEASGQRNVRLFGVNVNRSSRVETILRSLFPGDENGPTPNSSASQETGPAVEDEGVFLSNILRHIMPMISESTNEQEDDAENVDQPSSSRRPSDPRSQPDSKRQKRT